MKTEPRPGRARSVYIEYLEKRIAPATFVVTNLNDSGAGTLRDAVNKANAAPGLDAIVFKGAAMSGEITLTTGEIDITDSVNIKGPGAAKLTINAQDLSRIFEINDGTDAVKKVTISGLSIVDGNSGPGFGGGIDSRESLTLANSVVTGCRAVGNNGYGYGGAIYVITDGKVVIQNCKITGNTAGGGGGGLSISAEGDLQIINTLVSGNAAGRFAGGIYADILGGGTGDILISRSVITNNTAPFGGGAFVDNNRFVDGNSVGKITIQDTRISGNSATGVFGSFLREGGGLNVNDGIVLVEGCTITNNVAVDHGAGLHVHDTDSLTIRNSRITNNATTSPTGSGGGIYIDGDGTNAMFQSTTVSNNMSSGDGGGVAAFNSRLTIQKSTISGNTTGEDGGGIYAKQGTLIVDHSNFLDNRAVRYGGGISTMGTGVEKTDLRITNSLFTSNRAGFGGGVNTQGDGSVSVIGSRFLQNIVTGEDGDGGGLYLTSNTGTISIAGSLFAQNSVAGDGGGVALRGGATPITITNTVISDNTASDDGGGIALFGGTLRITNSTVINNVAASQGGGIWSQSDIRIIINSLKLTGNIAPIGPQIFEPPLM